MQEFWFIQDAFEQSSGNAYRAIGIRETDLPRELLEETYRFSQTFPTSMSQSCMLDEPIEPQVRHPWVSALMELCQE